MWGFLLAVLLGCEGQAPTLHVSINVDRHCVNGFYIDYYEIVLYDDIPTAAILSDIAHRDHAPYFRERWFANMYSQRRFPVHLGTCLDLGSAIDQIEDWESYGFDIEWIVYGPEYRPQLLVDPMIEDALKQFK